MLEIKNREYKIDEFFELKYFVKNGYKTRPKCSLCNKDASFNHSKKRYSRNCEKHKYQVFCSLPEDEVYTYIKEIYSGKIERTYRLPGTGELDIYIPQLKLGFEYNGLYWHSEKIKPKEYHYEKWKKFNEKDIRMITIWEDDWNYKNDIIKSIIRNALNLVENKIYARECKLNIVNKNDTQIFLEKNHIQGNCVSSINIGLYYNDELVSLMTFGKKRMIMRSKSNNENEYELLRFCNKLNTSVVGGITKLFSYFIKNYNPTSIISYVNLDLFNGNSYKMLGFECNSPATLNYWWAKEKRYHRSKFMKHKLVEQGADPNKTEDEIMRERYYNKVWGCGNVKWIYNSC